MDTLQFIAALVSSLAWPAAVVLLAFLLRVPITRLLLTLTHLRYKDLELDFGRELKEIKEEAKAINIAPKRLKRPMRASTDSVQLLGESEEIARDFPESAIAVAWQAVEAELMAAVMRLAISPDYPPYNSPLKNAQLLKEQNVIDDHTFDVLNRMRVLRNSVVHGARRAAITTNEAMDFIALAGGIVERLQSLHRS